MNKIYFAFIKRILDLIVSIIGIIVLSPVFLLLIVSLSIANKGTPFFSQKRPGMQNKRFNLIKFKTMTDEVDESGILLPDESRLTRIGSIVRKTSLDETPQLINVLFGNMSLVGPRPLLEEYLPLYDNEQIKRHNVRPGITGWAQVNGRNRLSWNQKFEYDIWYVENITFLLDLKIIYLTINRVITSDGISSKNCLTAEKFTGNK